MGVETKVVSSMLLYKLTNPGYNATVNLSLSLCSWIELNKLLHVPVRIFRERRILWRRSNPVANARTWRHMEAICNHLCIDRSASMIDLQSMPCTGAWVDWRSLHATCTSHYSTTSHVLHALRSSPSHDRVTAWLVVLPSYDRSSGKSPPAP